MFHSSTPKKARATGDRFIPLRSSIASIDYQHYTPPRKELQYPSPAPSRTASKSLNSSLDENVKTRKAKNYEVLLRKAMKLPVSDERLFHFHSPPAASSKNSSFNSSLDKLESPRKVDKTLWSWFQREAALMMEIDAIDLDKRVLAILWNPKFVVIFCSGSTIVIESLGGSFVFDDRSYYRDWREIPASVRSNTKGTLLLIGKIGEIELCDVELGKKNSVNFHTLSTCFHECDALGSITPSVCLINSVVFDKTDHFITSICEYGTLTVHTLWFPHNKLYSVRITESSSDPSISISNHCYTIELSSCNYYIAVLSQRYGSVYVYQFPKLKFKFVHENSKFQHNKNTILNIDWHGSKPWLALTSINKVWLLTLNGVQTEVFSCDKLRDDTNDYFVMQCKWNHLSDELVVLLRRLNDGVSVFYILKGENQVAERVALYNNTVGDFLWGPDHTTLLTWDKDRYCHLTTWKFFGDDSSVREKLIKKREQKMKEESRRVNMLRLLLEN